VFEKVDPVPLAAGTIAEVHRAVMANGERAVIKVQRPEAKELIEQDLALLEVFAEKVSDRPKLRAVIDMQAVFSHLSDSLHRELDFRQEAANMERLREVIARYPRLAVPELHADLSTSRLLVMRDVAGGPISIAPEGAPRKEAARQLLESFYKQILEDGFFHADPHPGNLMWQPEEDRLYFLDLGMVGEVSPQMREQMMLLLMAFWQEDVGFLTDVTLMLTGAIDRADLDVDAFSEEVGQLMAKNRGASLSDIQLGPILQEMTEIGVRHGVPLPASLTLMGKAMAQMQLATAQLDPTLDPFEVAGRFAMRSVVTGMGGKLDPKALFFQVQKLKVRAGRLIESIERLIGARPGQKLEVNFRAASLEQTVRRAGRHLSLGAVAAASLLGTAIVTTSDRVEPWVAWTLGGVGALFTIGLIVDLVRNRR
jgi:predicted unusual protein kinase regulating ubiquinone biosynthesis (AarF/ABC1/UbiB family)